MQILNLKVSPLLNLVDPQHFFDAKKEERKSRGRLGRVRKCFQSSLGLVKVKAVAKKIHNNQFIRLFCEVLYSWSEHNRPFQVIDMESLQKELAKIQVTAPDINSLP